MASTLCQKWFKKPVFFVKKPKNSWSLCHTILFKFHQHVAKYLSNRVLRDFRLPMSALATVAEEIFNGIFTAKIDFPLGHFTLPLLMLTLEVQSLSICYLISIWTTCWWNLNEIVGSELYKILSFWQSVDAILKDVPVTETIVRC